MDWNALTSKKNLLLAWRRVNTGRNFQHKRFFRDAYLAYETGLPEHIDALHKALRVGAWMASHGERIYIPKPSGLQRPLTYLSLEDQIVYQAIANRVAVKLKTKRGNVENSCVFSNIVNHDSDSIFFTEEWQTAYHDFCEDCKGQFDIGRRWAAFFDLAAYYDTISHELLKNTIAPRGGNQEVWRSAVEWLQTWCSSRKTFSRGHGLPQGPIASDFLAEIFFLPIDTVMMKENVGYFRYVDDIRLYGRNENDVRKAAILLEQLCRNYGLIPQSSKFGIEKLSTREEALGKLPSIPPQSSKRESRFSFPAIYSWELLQTSVNGKPERVIDKSRFRYVLYRAPRDEKILSCVLRLLPRHPEHIDAFVFYFGNYDKKLRLVRRLIDILQGGIPYSYVRGELWHVIARLANKECLERALPTALDDVKIRKDCVALSWGVMHFLIKCEEFGVHKLNRRLESENGLSRSLLCPIVPVERLTRQTALTMLSGSIEEQLSASRYMQMNSLKLRDLNLRQSQVGSSAKIALKSFDVIRRRYQPNRDWIEEILSRRYSCGQARIWRNLLGIEYAHALQILIEGEACFNPMISNWLSLQDSFNDILTRKFIMFCNGANLLGRQINTVNPNTGRNIDFGVLVQSNGILEQAYPVTTIFLREIHQRRNKLPGSHPYDSRTGNRNRFLMRGEQSLLVAKLCAIYQDIVIQVRANS